MSVTVANLITNLDSYIGDASTDRISQAERFQALTEATVWLNEELGNDHATETYTLSYYDTINYYKVTNSITDLLASADLRRETKLHTISAMPKSSRELAEMIGQNSTEFAWAVEQKDNDRYLAIVCTPENRAIQIATFDTTTSDGGTWEADTTASDATNVTADSNEYVEGAGSLNFDVDVSQSGNNRATIYNDELNTKNLSTVEDTGTFLFNVYVPDVTYFSSVTLYWGNSDSVYWAATASTDIDGSAFVAGWNTVKIDWADATATGSPDAEAIDYIRIDMNYTASQTDDTDFRIDDLRVAKAENLTFHYTSWNVGTNSSGTAIKAFTATTDIPYYSGKYDQYKYAVAHKAASTLFFLLRLRDEALVEEREALKQVERLKDIVPKSQTPETHAFKVRGINFNTRRRYR